MKGQACVLNYCEFSMPYIQLPYRHFYRHHICFFEYLVLVISTMYRTRPSSAVFSHLFRLLDVVLGTLSGTNSFGMAKAFLLYVIICTWHLVHYDFGAIHKSLLLTWCMSRRKILNIHHVRHPVIAPAWMWYQLSPNQNGVFRDPSFRSTLEYFGHYLLVPLSWKFSTVSDSELSR